jgi:fructosamine-3-kinase
VIPPDLLAAVSAALGATIRDIRPVHGGDINQAARLVLPGGEAVFLKWNRGVPPDFFAAEAAGLRVIQAAGAIRVPEVLAVGATPAFLALEWIEPGGRGMMTAAFAERLGHELAALHATPATEHGFPEANYIGSLPQPNGQTRSWVAFYRDERIGAQMAIARRLGRLPAPREQALERLQAWLPVFLDDEAIAPGLLHGDLWGGNFMAAASGDPVLIDPAVYFGHREVDLAMTELFGGFPPDFYAAYGEVHPLDGYTERRALYQLYPLLVHMNLFGGGYAIVRHYVG